AADPCAKIAKKSVVSYNDVLACYDNFKLTDKVRDGVSDTLKKILPFYAFIDIAKRSPDPKVPSYIDIEAELNKVLSKKYDTERDFQVSIAKFFNTLEDGHTRYTSQCFTSFVFRQPFPLYPEEGKWGEIRVKIPQGLKYTQPLLDAWKAAGVDVLSYAGAEVLSIDGKQPLEFVEEYAKHYVGTSRDVNSRMNYALARSIQSNGQWGISYGSFGSTTIPPVKETLTFRIRVGNDEKEVVVPYIATPNVALPFTNADSFYKNNCGADVPKAGDNKNANELQLLEVPEVKEIPIEAPIESKDSRLIDPLLTAVVDGTYVKTYILPDNVGVVHISTFSADNRLKWFTEIIQGFKTLQDEKVEKLILDVSNNGGGYICWGYNVLDYLFPNATTKFFNTDMHYSPLLAKLTQNEDYGFFNPGSYNQPDGKPFATENAFTEIKTYYRGINRNSQYTPQFQEKCGANPLRSLLVNNTQPFKTENIALVSNSICYSTCTLLSNGMQEFHDVKSYAFGGLKYKDATIGSLGGGTVYSLDGLLGSLEYSGLNKDPAAPQPLPTKGGVRFTVRESYSSRFKELRPLEFTWNPAKNHKAYNADTAFNPYKVW
ncbi:ClpP/crotonase, partial [Neoconidiobolus thromboides FSU 785]